MARTGAPVAVVIACGLLGRGVSAQTLNPSPREVLGLRRPLTDAETSLVLAAARQASAGRGFQLRVRPDGSGPLFVMRDDGRPRYLQMTSGADVVEGWSSAGSSPEHRSIHVNVTTFIHYPGTQARGCDGTTRDGELVIEYENKNAGWTAKARVRSTVEVNDSAFAMLAGEVAVMSGAQGGWRARRARVRCGLSATTRRDGRTATGYDTVALDRCRFAAAGAVDDQPSGRSRAEHANPSGIRRTLCVRRRHRFAPAERLCARLHPLKRVSARAAASRGCLSWQPFRRGILPEKSHSRDWC